MSGERVQSLAPKVIECEWTWGNLNNGGVVTSQCRKYLGHRVSSCMTQRELINEYNYCHKCGNKMILLNATGKRIK